jgi:hypothetical protein
MLLNGGNEAWFLWERDEEGSVEVDGLRQAEGLLKIAAMR